MELEHYEIVFDHIRERLWGAGGFETCDCNLAEGGFTRKYTLEGLDKLGFGKDYVGKSLNLLTEIGGYCDCQVVTIGSAYFHGTAEEKAGHESPWPFTRE